MITMCQFRHYPGALLNLRELIARTKDQAHHLAQLHDDLSSFLTESKYALHRVLEL
jgi:hypothetical protein